MNITVRSATCLLSLLTASAVGAEILVSPPVRISRGGPHVEATIAADPTDARRLIATASEVLDRKGIIAKSFVSRDNGVTWREVVLPGMSDMFNGTLVHALDNWIAFDESGHAFLSTLAWMEETEKMLSVFVYRSTDAGEKWNGPSVILGRTFDRPGIVARQAEGVSTVIVAAAVAGRDEIALGAKREGEGFAVFRSDDGGKSFSRQAYVANDNLGHNSMNPLILRGNTVVVPLVDYPSRDSQRVRTSRLYLARSKDGGAAFGPLALIAEIPRPFPGHAQIAVDGSTGRLFAVWNGGLEGERDVSVAYSDDEGNTWSPPRAIRLADRGPALRPSIAVSRRGSVAIAFLQRERGEKPCWRPYVAVSDDHGASYSSPHPVTERVSCGDTPENRRVRIAPHQIAVVDRWEDGGDYIGITAAADGGFHIVWPDTRDGAFHTYTARVSTALNVPPPPAP